MEDDSDSSFYSDDAVLLSDLIEYKKLYPPKKSVVTPPNEDPPAVTSPMVCNRNLQETSYTFNREAEEDVEVVNNHEDLDDNSDSSFYSDDAVLLSELIEEYKKLYPPKETVQQDSVALKPKTIYPASSKPVFIPTICKVTDPGRKLQEMPCNSNHDIGEGIEVVNNHEEFNDDKTRLKNELIDTRQLLNNAKESLRMLKHIYWLRNSEGEGCESIRSSGDMKKEYGVLIQKSGSLAKSKRKMVNEVRTTRQSIGIMTEELCRVLGVTRKVDFPWENGMPYSRRRV